MVQAVQEDALPGRRPMKIPAFKQSPPFHLPDGGLRARVYARHAKRAGIPTAFYIAQIDAGLKFCSRCRRWLRRRDGFQSGRVACRTCDAEALERTR